MLEYERKYWSKNKQHIAGIDEAGRGPLAGPVVAAAVIFPHDINLPEVNDSKKISEKKRERLYDEIYDSAISIGIGIVYEKEIDEINILQATYQAMRQSIGKLSVRPEVILVDGNKADIKHYEQDSIIDGDQKSLSIAAASIIAKVTRDRIMRKYDIVFPKYGFAKHKGYGTKHHIEALNNSKATPIHRKSFNPVANHLPTFEYYKRNHLFESLGIQLVACRMVRLGYEILETNYTTAGIREVDIISNFKNNIVFTEVRTQLAGSCNYNLKLIDSKKNEDYINAAELYLDSNKLNYKYRFEIGEVILGGNSPKIKIEENKILVH